jgi:hypothetical protein
MRTPSSDRVPHSRRTPSSNRQQDTTRRDDHQRPTTTTTNAHGNQPPYPPQTPKTGQPTKSVPRAKPLSGRAPRAGHLAHGTQQAPPEHPTSPPRTQLATPPIPPHGAPRAPAPTSTHAPTSHPTNATTVSHKAKNRDARGASAGVASLVAVVGVGCWRFAVGAASGGRGAVGVVGCGACAIERRARCLRSV